MLSEPPDAITSSVPSWFRSATDGCANSGNIVSGRLAVEPGPKMLVGSMPRLGSPVTGSTRSGRRFSGSAPTPG